MPKPEGSQLRSLHSLCLGVMPLLSALALASLSRGEERQQPLLTPGPQGWLLGIWGSLPSPCKGGGREVPALSKASS